MPFDPRAVPPMFHIDVTADQAMNEAEFAGDKESMIIGLLRQVVAGQEKQRALLEELVQYASAQQKQRAAELGNWKQANPDLARRCRTAAETLARVQNQILDHLTNEIEENEECLLDGEFMLNEFVDRFGPRLAHLNGMAQVLAQLSIPPETAKTPHK